MSMLSSSAAHTILRVLSALFLVTALFLEIIANSAMLGKFTVTVTENLEKTTMSVSYYLWYLEISTYATYRLDYSPGRIVACRALLIVAILVTILLVCVVMHDLVRHCCRTAVTRMAKRLLYVLLSFSCVVVMLLIGFIVAFNAYFQSKAVDPNIYPGSSRTNSSTSASWEGGMKCVVMAVMLCFLSSMVDAVLLRLAHRTELDVPVVLMDEYEPPEESPMYGHAQSSTCGSAQPKVV